MIPTILFIACVIYIVKTSHFLLDSRPCSKKQQPVKKQRAKPPTVAQDLGKFIHHESAVQPFDVVVVGAGLSGAVIAERHASVLGQRVLVVEKRDHIGGNCYDFLDPDTGIRVNKYGAHLFHTNSEEVWNYIRKFGQWDAWEHRVLAFVNSQYVPVPVNIDTVNKLFHLNLQTSAEMNEWLGAQQIHATTPKNSEEMALSRVGRDLYDLIFKPYTEKQWNKSVSQLGPEVTGRIPVRDNWDNRYFSDKYQVLPRRGYTDFFNSMISANPLVEVHTNTDYFQLPGKLQSRITPSTKVFYTGPIDRFFSSEKQLEYRSLKFLRVVKYNQPGYFLPAPVVNYPGKEFQFTRVVEYKHMLNQSSGASVLHYEFPSEDGDPYYPVPTPENKALYSRLVEMSQDIPQVKFVGRLANYKYFNMDEAISNALNVFRNNSALPVADIHVVTNIFNEDLGWQETLCKLLVGKTVRWFVFDKGSVHPHHTTVANQKNACETLGWYHIPLPNVGREGHSWITYIQNGLFANTNVFMQGKPTSVLSRVAELSLKHSSDLHHGALPGFIPMDFPIICSPRDDPYFDMSFFHNELVKIAAYLQAPMETMCHSYFGEFIASRDALEFARTKHTEFIGAVLIPGLESANDPPMGHALERSWVTFLSEPPSPKK